MTLDLPLIFTVLMGVAILAYVVLDGYDLGVGMLMPAADDAQQQLMVASIGPFWDANETWLVLGVGIMLVAFPVAHGFVLGNLYLPVVAMLVGLMLRGVAFEFRIKAVGWHREQWNWLFWFGSFAASFSQGVMLGRYITGFEEGIGYFLFSLLVGASVCGGYVLLGATWLVLRTEGALHDKSLAWARWGLLWIALGVALVSLATPLLSETVRNKWFDFPATLPLMLLPLASAGAWAWVWVSTGRLKRRAPGAAMVADWAPFAGAVAIFVLAFAGLAYSLFPYVVMDKLTIWRAAAHPSSLKVVLAGVAVVLPMIVIYTIVSYRIFSGKVTQPLYH
jgi:cytochrome bd ubiquinol oxidase subunit II